MKRIATPLILVALLAVASRGLTADGPLVLDVWPGQAPGETGPIGAERSVEVKPLGILVKGPTNVSRPTLTVFRPAKAKDTGAAVLVCPGGGYNIIPWEREGAEPAAWLNSLGVTALVLKYRVPRRPDQPKDSPPPGPLQDAQRALSLVRHKAREWGIDSNRIGILGFSAGAHLAASVSTGFDRRAYTAVDAVDQISCRPDFAVLVYPGYLLARDQEELVPQIRVRKECPPMFLVHAGDDPVPAENSVLLYLALKRAGVPAELHVYATGGTASPCVPARSRAPPGRSAVRTGSGARDFSSLVRDREAAGAFRRGSVKGNMQPSWETLHGPLDQLSTPPSRPRGATRGYSTFLENVEYPLVAATVRGRRGCILACGGVP